MGTRAVIRITSSGLPFVEERHYIYRHWDGDPATVIQSIRKAFALATATTNEFQFEKAGRVGKVASFIYASEPGEYEPLMHPWDCSANNVNYPYPCDLAYVYHLHIVNKHDGGIRWILAVRTFNNNRIVLARNLGDGDLKKGALQKIKFTPNGEITTE